MIPEKKPDRSPVTRADRETEQREHHRTGDRGPFELSSHDAVQEREDGQDREVFVPRGSKWMMHRHPAIFLVVALASSTLEAIAAAR